MKAIVKSDTIDDYNRWAGVETLNPLVSVIDFGKVQPLRHARKLYGFYAVFLKDAQCGELRYGCKQYDYKDGTVLFVAPGQVFGAEDNGELFQPDGHVLLFHPDLLRNTHLAKTIRSYSFFSYDADEALHLSNEERTLIMDCFNKIRYELSHAIDKHSKQLIVDSIKMLLDYCTRFYDRQFITRENENIDILARVEKIVDNYFASGMAEKKGLPNVQYVAEQVNLSTNYFSDMMRKETGMSPLYYIHEKLIELAKTELVASSQSISEVAYKLGFQYSQHFTRLFKRKVGMTPNEYRQQMA